MRTVSVALCTYDGERYVEEQLRSILAQSMPVHEIVVGDDGSSDGTLDVVARVAATSDVPIIVREHAQLGVAANFADAIAHTSGDLVALCDQDDVWHVDRVAGLVDAIDGVDLVHTDARLVDAHGAPLGATLLDTLALSDWELDRMQHGGALEALLRRNLVTGATVLVRRDAAVAALPIPAGWIHDEWIAMVCALGGGVRLVPEATIDYRQHGANAIGVRSLSFRERLARLVEQDSGSHARKAERATSLAAEAARRGLGTDEQRARLVEKARHERTRARLPDARIARVPAILRGILRGGYARYSRGALDVGRDLLEAH